MKFVITMQRVPEIGRRGGDKTQILRPPFGAQVCLFVCTPTEGQKGGGGQSHVSRFREEFNAALLIRAFFFFFLMSVLVTCQKQPPWYRNNNQHQPLQKLEVLFSRTWKAVWSSRLPEMLMVMTVAVRIAPTVNSNFYGKVEEILLTSSQRGPDE